MDSQKIFQGIYEDFFGVEDQSVAKDDEKQIVMSDIFDRIDKLLLDDDSKNLLKQIIEYMRKYNEKIESNYVPFNIVVDNTDKNNAKEIISIVEQSASQYNYVDNNKTKLISFYHVNNDFDLTSIYNEFGIVVIDDIDGFSSLEDKQQKAIINDLYNNINKAKTITMLCGDSQNINDFLLNSKDLKEYISFYLNYQKPDIQDIYQSILDKTDITDEQKVELLDYITQTYDKSELDSERSN